MRRFSWVAAAILVVLGMTAFFLPTSSANHQKPVATTTTTVTSPAYPDSGITHVVLSSTDSITGKTTVYLDAQYDFRGIVRSCGPCPPGQQGMGTLELAEYLKIKHYGVPSVAGRALIRVTVQHGWYCDPFGNCAVDPLYVHDMDVGWYYGSVRLYAAAHYINGCGWWACLALYSSVPTPHGHNPQLHYNYWGLGPNVPTSVTYEDNFLIGIAIPDSSTGIHYEPHWPWGYNTVIGDGTWYWDADFDCQLDFCY